MSRLFLLTLCAVVSFALGLFGSSTTTKKTQKPQSKTPQGKSSSKASSPSHKGATASKGAKAKTSTTARKSSVKSSTKTAARKTATRPQPVRRPGQAVPSQDRIREIQEALSARGYTAPPSGSWDSQTIDAMKRFQQDQNLEPTGKLTSVSLIALGLGPRRVAVSPPKPNPDPARAPSPPATQNQ